ncbi:hypothetical protein C5167_011659 [Papaver somniferum]|uniref:Uncharacterized protein n=1 Tax=Papaver somniferum TaxID=3469 RepID=A0A4Y7K7Q6_PAPSO|nr:hypothetical protein C5167_011659 [Papaver somniferum]
MYPRLPYKLYKRTSLRALINIGGTAGTTKSLKVATRSLLQVLSVTLDDWSDEEIESMIKVGGKFSANSIYEASIPDGISKQIQVMNDVPSLSDNNRSLPDKGSYVEKIYQQLDSQPDNSGSGGGGGAMSQKLTVIRQTYCLKS